MSNKSIKEGLSAIASEVLDDVQKEAERIIAVALARAKEALSVAKESADQYYQALTNEATDNAKTHKRSTESLTEVETRNRMLQAKEALVNESFQKAMEDLRGFVKTEKYHEKLLVFIEEAAAKLGDERLVVHVNAADRDWLSYEKLSALSRELNVNMEVATEPETCLGGCIVQTADGKLTYDNTIENRMQQLKSELRFEVAKILFGNEVEAYVR